jgi:hypothetical protein
VSREYAGASVVGRSLSAMGLACAPAGILLGARWGSNYSGLQLPGHHRGKAMPPAIIGSVAFPGRARRSREHTITVAVGCAVQSANDGSSGADRLRTAPATAGEALSFASSSRSWTATCDSVCSPARSTSPMTETIRGPTISRRR